MSNDPSLSLSVPTAKLVVRYVETEMTPEVRASAGLRHTKTLTKWREVKAAKKQAVADFAIKLDTLDTQALSLETATRAKDGELVSLPMPCKEQPLYREDRKCWGLAVYKIDEDPLTGEEVELFERWEDLPDDLLHLNQGTLPFPKQPPPGGGEGGAGGGSDRNDKLGSVDFPDEDEDDAGGDDAPVKPVQPGEKAPKKSGGRGKKK